METAKMCTKTIVPGLVAHWVVYRLGRSSAGSYGGVFFSSRLVKECGVMYLSSGEPLRDEVSHCTKLRKQVEAINKSGVLVIPVLRCRLLFLAYNEY
jgi:hypothetical protein